MLSKKGLRTSPNSDSGDCTDHGLGGGDDGAAERAMEFCFINFGSMSAFRRIICLGASTGL